MEWFAITNPWLWLAAATAFIVLLGFLLTYNARRSRTQEALRAQQTGWTPTGRIDFAGPTDVDPDAIGNFLLQAEDTRIVNSVGGVDHREIRWRRATLSEAKKVVLAYHAQRNLATTTALVVDASKSAAAKPELAKAQEGLAAIGGAAEAKSHAASLTGYPRAVRPDSR
jgi:hypothetical protein